MDTVMGSEIFFLWLVTAKVQFKIISLDFPDQFYQLWCGCYLILYVKQICNFYLTDIEKIIS